MQQNTEHTHSLNTDPKAGILSSSWCPEKGPGVLASRLHVEFIGYLISDWSIKICIFFFYLLPLGNSVIRSLNNSKKIFGKTNVFHPKFTKISHKTNMYWWPLYMLWIKKSYSTEIQVEKKIYKQVKRLIGYYEKNHF